MQTNGMEPIDVEIKKLKDQSTKVLTVWKQTARLFQIVIVLMIIVIGLNIYRAYQLDESINQSTTDYKMFKSIVSNREVDKKHVKKLIESIEKKNLLFIRPILCNECLDVIDGQHRLEACMVMNISVPYMICPGLVKEDIHFLNSVQKNWTTIDFINYFTIEDKSGFREFSRFANQYQKMKISILLKLCSNRRNTKIRDGHIDIDKIDEARIVCDNLIKLNNVWKKKKEFDFVFSAAFAMAMQKCVRNRNFDIDVLYEKIVKYPDMFKKYTSRNEYLKSIHLIYNKDSENKIDLAPVESLI